MKRGSAALSPSFRRSLPRCTSMVRSMIPGSSSPWTAVISSSREKTRVGRRISACRRRNSIGVMSIRRPSRSTSTALGSRTRPGAARIGSSVASADVASELDAYACHELTRAEGLDDVVIGAQVQAHDLIRVPGAGGQEHDRYVGFLAKLTANLEAVESRQHDVEQDERGPMTSGRRQRFCAVCRRHGPVSLALDVQAHEVANLRVVVNDQNGGHPARKYVRHMTDR